MNKKISLGYLQQNQIKVNQLLILKMPCPSHLPLFHYLLLQQMVQCEKQKNLIYMVQWFTLKSQHITEKLHWCQLFICQCSCGLKRVKNVPKTFEDLTIKLINDVPQRCNEVYFVCDLTLKSPLKQQNETIEGVRID